MLARMFDALDTLSKAQAWAWLHPYTIALVFGVLGALLNWVGKPRTAAEYAAMSPKRAAFFRMSSALLPDLAKFFDGARNYFTNSRPDDAPNVVMIGQATLEQVAATLVTKALEAQKKRAAETKSAAAPAPISAPLPDEAPRS